MGKIYLSECHYLANQRKVPITIGVVTYKPESREVDIHLSPNKQFILNYDYTMDDVDFELLMSFLEHEVTVELEGDYTFKMFLRQINAELMDNLFITKAPNVSFDECILSEETDDIDSLVTKRFSMNECPTCPKDEYCDYDDDYDMFICEHEDWEDEDV